MKLGNILDELRYGKEFVESNLIINSDKNYINEDYGFYMVSKKVDELLKECNSAKSYTKRLYRASKTYSDFEKRLMEGSDISPIYGRMKIESITNDINESIKELENRVTLKESNKEALANIIATLKYGIEVISENTQAKILGINKGIEEFDKTIEKYATLLTETTKKIDKKAKKVKTSKEVKDNNPKFEAKESDVAKDFVKKPVDLIKTPEKAPAGKENNEPKKTLLDFVESKKK